MIENKTLSRNKIRFPVSGKIKFKYENAERNKFIWCGLRNMIHPLELNVLYSSYLSSRKCYEAHVQEQDGSWGETLVHKLRNWLINYLSSCTLIKIVMALCKQTAHEFIQNTFSPAVAVLCSPDAEVLCQKNNLTFVELVQPFCRLTTEGTVYMFSCIMKEFI